MVDLVRAHIEQNRSNAGIEEIANTVTQRDPKFQWFDTPLVEKARAIDAVVGITKLLFFIDLGFRPDPSKTIPQLLVGANIKQVDGILSDDFSAKTLDRVADFDFQWTSDLSQHLMLHDKTIKFFRVAAFVTQLESKHSELFPKDFLDEVARTILLFFPVEGYKTQRRTRKIERGEAVDLEAGPRRGERSLSLEDYPYHRERLMIIQSKYDESRPRHLKQWWFDRRRRVEWLGLQIALFSFVVTAIFMIMSAVTGLLQVLKDWTS